MILMTLSSFLHLAILRIADATLASQLKPRHASHMLISHCMRQFDDIFIIESFLQYFHYFQLSTFSFHSHYFSWLIIEVILSEL
jgi:hypothetical protein